MKKIIDFLFALTLIVSITACGGGGGGSDTPPANADPVESNFFAQGIYLGTATNIDGETSESIAIISADGTFEGYDLSDGGVAYGVLSSSSNTQASGDIRGLAGPDLYYTANGLEYIDAEISFTQSTIDKSLSGNTVYQGETQSSFTLYSQDFAYDNPPADFSSVAGTYSSYINYVDVYLAIDAQGNVSGYNDIGCQYSSTLTQTVTGKNIYSLALNVSACGDENGNYTGKAFFSSTETDLYFYFVAHNNTDGAGGKFRRIFQSSDAPPASADPVESNFLPRGYTLVPLRT